MKVRRASLISLLRQQTIYLSVAAIIAAVFWAIGLPVNPATIVVYSLLFGNSVTPVMVALGKFYWSRPFPWNWLLFLLLDILVLIPAYILASAVVFWVAPPSPGQTVGHLIRTGWRLPTLVVVVYSTIGFVYHAAKEKLEQRNRELQRSLEEGSAELRTQKMDLQRAREIQESLLPKTLPQLPGFEVAASWRPAREVSGDYFDVFRLGDHRIGFCIADVVGKGVSAALLMANVQAAVRAFADPRENTAAICTKVNRLLCENIAPGKFVTFLFGTLNDETHTVSWCNAGHLDPILVSQDHAQALNASGAVLGVFPAWSYAEQTIGMSPGDRLLLFTDGITEANGPGEQEFGDDRVAQCAELNRRRAASEIGAALLAEVDAFCEGHFQDDATLLVIAAK